MSFSFSKPHTLSALLFWWYWRWLSVVIFVVLIVPMRTPPKLARKALGHTPHPCEWCCLCIYFPHIGHIFPLLCVLFRWYVCVRLCFRCCVVGLLILPKRPVISVPVLCVSLGFVELLIMIRLLGWFGIILRHWTVVHLFPHRRPCCDLDLGWWIRLQLGWFRWQRQQVLYRLFIMLCWLVGRYWVYMYVRLSVGWLVALSSCGVWPRHRWFV